MKKNPEARIDIDSITHRLNRIEGQVRGIKGMIEKESPCVEVLNQVASVQSALNSVKKILFERHLRMYLLTDDAIEQKCDELIETMNFVF